MTATATPELEKMQAQNYGTPDKPSLMEGLDAFFGGIPVQQPEPVAATEPEPVKAEPAKAEPAPEPKAEVKAKAEPVAADILPFEEEGFGKPDNTEDKKDPTAFDEVAFDAQTDLEVKGMDAKAGEKFKSLKAELKALKQAVPVAPADVLKRVEEAELKAKEADGLRERLKSASAASAKLEVENDDNYIREVKVPYNAVMARLDKLSEVYEMDPSILRAIVREEDIKVQDEMIKTHLVNFSEVRRQEVFSAIPKVGELIDKHEVAMQNAEADFGAREAKRIQDTERLLGEQKKAVQTITQDKWKRWESTIPGLLDEDGSPTEAYTKLKNESLSLDFSQSRAADQAYAAFAGTAFPHIMKENIALQRRLAEYEKDDKRLLKAAPKTGDSLATPVVTAEKPKTFMEGFLATNFTG